MSSIENKRLLDSTQNSYSSTDNINSRRQSQDSKVEQIREKWIFNMLAFVDRWKLKKGAITYEEIIRNAPQLENIHFYSDITDDNFAPIATALAHSKIQHISFIHCHNFTGSNLTLLKAVQSICFFDCEKLGNLDLRGCTELRWLDLASCPQTKQILVSEKRIPQQFRALECGHFTELAFGTESIKYTPTDFVKKWPERGVTIERR